MTDSERAFSRAMGKTEGEIASYEQTEWINKQPHAGCGGCQTLLAKVAELESSIASLETHVASLALRPTADWPLNEAGTARLRPDGRPGCADCGELYGGPRFPDLVIDAVAFSHISPNPPDGGLFCPNCLNARVEVSGRTGVQAVFMTGPFASAEMMSTTEAIRVILKSAFRKVLGRIKSGADDENPVD